MWYNIETQIYSIDEFIKVFDEAIKNKQKSASEYFDEICGDYQRRIVTKTETIPPYALTYLGTSHMYFGYFNYMLERTSKDETVIMLVKNKKANQLLLIQEIEIIVNRLVYVFNNLGATFALFNRELEIPQIQTGNWNKILILNDVDICLTKVKEPSMLCLWIKLKQPISTQS